MFDRLKSGVKSIDDIKNDVSRCKGQKFFSFVGFVVKAAWIFTCAVENILNAETKAALAVLCRVC